MVVLGSTTGAISQFLASPTDLVKVIMQADGKRALEGHPRRFKFFFNNFFLILTNGSYYLELKA
jgi:solute carrier family 25 (mitochondrial uncoupling protein), member 27